MREVLLPVHIEPLEDGGYLVTSDALPGLLAQGRTIAEALEIAQDVARKLIESYRDHGDPLPPALEQLATGDGDLSIPVTVA